MAKQDHQSQPKSSQPAAAQPAPGLDLEKFKAAVDALVHVRDSGDFVVFFSRRNSIRFVGKLERFRVALEESSPGHGVTDDDARVALDELRSILSIYVRTKNVSHTIDFLRYSPTAYRAFDLSSDAKARAAVEQKIKTAVDKLLTEALTRRIARVSTSVGLCLEDIDVDVVALLPKEDPKAPSDPFVRLRLRNSSPEARDDSATPFFYPFSSGTDNGQPFELDCDESDINFLIYRLLTAKEVLAQAKAANSPKSVGGAE